MKTDLTTGLPGLDKVLRGVMAGDNIVWNVDSIDEYRALVLPYVQAARRAHLRLVYFRFADHEQLVPSEFGAEVHRVDPARGFECFVTDVHKVIEDAGRGAIYVFDCLSDLAAIWQSDQMLGNFFVLTCPRLHVLETVTYFAIYRNSHTSFALDPITQTTQFLLDVFRHADRLYVRPIKVQHRSTSSMNTMHLWEDAEFKPITNSAIITEVLSSARWPGLRVDNRREFWQRTFAEAESLAQQARPDGQPTEQQQDMFNRLSTMVLARDQTMSRLIHQHMDLSDVLNIHNRMIGNGLIGGKAVGMLLARTILEHADPRFKDLLETHDSFYIGSEVFYTFLVRNGVWWLRQKQSDPETFLDGLDEARVKILRGDFLDDNIRQFREIIDYFGESPYIVRSSSLQEDNYGNAFAGKYDSVFCVNQGTREQRLEALLDAVRQVYASTMSDKALRYRLGRGLLGQDEQMALLVMRVSGAVYDTAFYPQVAGVGFSYNPYVWNQAIDPKAGVIRLVFGLGTRAVDRTDDDYTRIVALNAPEKRPEANFDEVRDYSQRRVDYLDLAANRLTHGDFNELVARNHDLPIRMFASPAPVDDPTRQPHWVLTFDRLLSRTSFVQNMRDMLRILEQAYGCPVDIEFTANFIDDDRYRINLLQCRPLQVQGTGRSRLPRLEVPAPDSILEARGAVIGHSRIIDVDRFVYVVPSAYAALTLAMRHEVARVIGRINHACSPERTIMLMGPGRWGTSSPELGIPVHFAEINRIAVLCEIVAMRENLVPDVSLGTHFLNELVEGNILYLALFPRQDRNLLRESFFLEAPNHLSDLTPRDKSWEDLIRVVDSRDIAPTRGGIRLHADALDQRVAVFIDRRGDRPHVPASRDD
ncbi:MAG: PEP/pyruvate-binding domain-containing protein [Phycisphaeraceae bacterium]|nr:PEP/pyruvate-binding domain-containing protein [Phycisphaeraceae bacterium]